MSPIYTISEGFQPITISETLSNYNGYNVDCFGANSGSLSLDISGGSGIFEYIFSKYLEGIGKEGDCLLAISTSGNSKNILRAAKIAKNKNIKVMKL